jgi:hypothetical protein
MIVVLGTLWLSDSSQVVVASIFDVFGTGDSFKNITGGFASIITAVAIIIGGGWAYYRFGIERKDALAERPQFSVSIAGRWHRVDGVGDALHLCIEIKNGGIAIIPVAQYGTGMQVSFPSPNQGDPPDYVAWEPVPLHSEDGSVVPRTFEIFSPHDWLEPGESVTEDLLLNLGRTATIAMVEVSIRRGSRREEIYEIVRRIIPTDATMD